MKEIIFNIKTKGVEKASNEIDKITDSTKVASSGVDGLGDAFGSLPGPIGNVSGAVSGLGSQFKALLANPIVLTLAGIAAVLGTLYSAFSRTEQGSNRLNKATNVLKGVLSGFFKIIEPIANFIADVAVEAFDEFAKKAEDAAKGLEIIVGLFSSKAAQDVINFTKAIEGQIKASEKLADLEADLLVGKREQKLINKQALIDAEKLRQLRDDESFSIQERQKFNEQLSKVLDKQMEQETAIAKKALEAAQLKIKIDGRTTENLDAEADAKLALLDIEEAINGQKSEQLASLNGLRNEAKAANAEAKAASQEKSKLAEDEKIKISEAKQKIIDEQTKLEDELFISNQKRILSESDFEIQELIRKNEEKLLLAEGNAELEKEIIRQQDLDIQLIKDEAKIKADEIKFAEEEKRLENDRAYYSRQLQDLENFNNAQIKAEESLTNAKQNAKNAAISIAYQIAGENKNLANVIFGIEKGLAIGTVVVDTAKGISASMANLATVPPFLGPLPNPTYVLAAANTLSTIGSLKAGAALNIATIAATSIAKFASGGGGASVGGGSVSSGGGGGGSAPQPSTPNMQSLFATQKLEGAETEKISSGGPGSNQILRAYVSEREISSVQNRISSYEQRSEIG